MKSVRKIFDYFPFTVCTTLAVIFLITDSFPNWAFLVYMFCFISFFVRYIPWEKLQTFLQQKKMDIILSAGFVIATGMLYLFRITQITPGMWGDEVGLGWMVEELVHKTAFTPFLSYNYGHPTPLIYLSAIFISLMGRSIISLRIVSVIFGALSAGVFYIFLRQFFEKKYATIGTLLFSTSYVLIIVSRFAYEMSAGIFFFICSLLALYNFSEKPTFRRAIALGFSLAMGLYTYLAFRTLLPFFFLFALLSIWKRTKEKIRTPLFLVMSFCIVVFPLFSYSIHHPKEINARVDALSVFGQHLPRTEVIKELQGASFRTLTMFFTTGDPNPRQNPANTIPFDLITSILFFIGLGFLLVKKRQFGIPILLFATTILFTEIITLERIPEFHYYGLGHPNTLRISFLVPLVIFCAVWAIKFFAQKISDTSYQTFFISIVVVLISSINLTQYYNQPISTWIYTTNFVVPLNVVNFLNNEMPKDVTLSPTLYNSQHIRYFLNPNVHIHPVPQSFHCTFYSYPITVLFGKDLTNCTKSDFQSLQDSQSLSVYPMQNPWNTTDAIIVVKK